MYILFHNRAGVSVDLRVALRGGLIELRTGARTGILRHDSGVGCM